MKQLSILLLGVFLAACQPPEDEVFNEHAGTVQGLKPIYISNDDANAFSVSDARDISRLGKIYYKSNTIFVNEVNEGIHIIDNTNPEQPTPLKFLNIKGNKDIAIKGNVLYADNFTDLITIDISDINDIKFLNRVKDIYPFEYRSFPNDYVGYFECVDKEMGRVAGWENATLENPNCWRD